MRLLPAAAAAVFLFATACGYVAGVLPPLANIPATIGDLDAVQRGSNLIAHFTVPTATTEAYPIKPPLDLDLRVGIPPDPWNEAAWESHARRVAPDSLENGLATYTIPAAEWAGKDVVIAARAAGENRKPSQWSKLVAVPVIAPLPKPTDVALTPDPKGIRISWKAAAGHFRVLRKEDDEAAFKLIATVTAPEYFDATATLGKVYSYQVIAFQTVGENREAQSDLSEVANVAYKDVFPPAVPKSLRAAASAGSIELSWESNDEPDLASYRVYRSADGGAFERVGEVNLPAYSDRTVQTGHAYRYAITAVDQSGNESQRSGAVEAALR